jgi:hypothetical protein
MHESDDDFDLIAEAGTVDVFLGNLGCMMRE